MVIRPVPGPWRLPPAPRVRARYRLAAPEYVVFRAKCACGRDAQWTQHRDGQPTTVRCTCPAKENAA